jgi:hypothetical protein
MAARAGRGVGAPHSTDPENAPVRADRRAATGVSAGSP